MASERLIRQASYRGTRRYSDVRRREEVLPLLDDDDDHTDDPEDPSPPQPAKGPRAPNEFSDLPVFQNIWRIRREIVSNISDPYTLEQLRAPRLNTSVVRPLMEELYGLKDISIIYALLVNRYQFIRDQSYQAHYLSVNTARASLCELLAIKILRQYDEDSHGQNGLLLLANILIAGFEPFQNCPVEVSGHQPRKNKWPFSVDRGGFERHTTALEMAIISESKLFLSSPASQKVVDAIFIGRIMYTPTTFMDIIPDTYKRRSITLYNPEKHSLLNQYRLNVPRTRNVLEVSQFVLLLALFFLVQSTRDPVRFTVEEGIFCVYTFGWILDQVASILEHGWKVYSQNLWSFLDVMFAVIYVSYFILRMHGIHTNNIETSQPALDLLALGAPFLIPRLAFNLFSENILFVSLREMMAKFLLLTLLAVWTFAGFFLAMYWLAEGKRNPYTIGKWMVWVWFGLDGTGIQRAVEFHWLLGPVLMIAFAVFGNTLFLTVLVSTLSNTFFHITRAATAEVQFRHAVLTFEGVKSDALFAYQPPFNLIAMFILLPLRFVLTPRWFHKVHVTLVRFLNSPLLIPLCLWERRTLWPPSSSYGRAKHRQSRSSKAGSGYFPRLQVHGDIAAVFEAEPPSEREGTTSGHLTFEEPLNMLHQRDRRNKSVSRMESGVNSGVASRDYGSPTPAWLQRSSSSPRPRRRASVWSVGGLEEHVAGLMSDEATEGNRDMLMRLRKLEKSTEKIEKMVNRICESLENEGGDDPGQVDVDD